MTALRSYADAKKSQKNYPINYVGWVFISRIILVASMWHYNADFFKDSGLFKMKKGNHV